MPFRISRTDRRGRRGAALVEAVVVIPTFAILFGVFGLGPGSFSLDSRLFGRRAIIIPARSQKATDDRD